MRPPTRHIAVRRANGDAMIKYTLQCSDGHRFDSWFRDSAAFDALAAAGQVSCAVCGDADVEKAVMAPSVGGTREADETPLTQPAHPAEAALRTLRDHLEKKADYVGREFADEARRIHVGESDKRHIWGEATPAEAKALKDDGVPVSPLPFIAKRNA